MAGYYIEGAEFTVEGWKYVWLTSSIVCCLGGTFYALTASGNKQPWAEEKMSIKDQFWFELNQLMFKK